MGTTIPGATAANAKQQQVQNAVNLGVSLWNIFHKDQPRTQANSDDEPEADPAIESAARQQQINAEAAALLASANSALPSQPDATPGTQPNSTAAVSALLGDNTSSDTATAAVSSLLDDGTQPNTDENSTARAVAGLLDMSNVSDSASAFPPAMTSGATAETPQDPQIATAYSSSADSPPDPTRVAALDNTLFDSSAPDPSFSDILRNMGKTASNAVKTATDAITSVQEKGIASTIGDAFNDPTMQGLAQRVGLSPRPNADPIDSAVHNCGIALAAGGPLPYPVGQDAGAASCMNGIQKAGMNVLGMATDQ